MENRTKRPVTYMLIFAIFLAIAFHLDKMPNFFSYFFGITFPLLIGAIMAFILNVPMHGFEKLLEKEVKINSPVLHSLLNANFLTLLNYEFDHNMEQNNFHIFSSFRVCFA